MVRTERQHVLAKQRLDEPPLVLRRQRNLLGDGNRNRPRGGVRIFSFSRDGHVRSHPLHLIVVRCEGVWVWEEKEVRQRDGEREHLRERKKIVSVNVPENSRGKES